MNFSKSTIYQDRNEDVIDVIPNLRVIHKSPENFSQLFFDNLIKELGEDAFNYLEELGVLSDHNIILLSPSRHFLYTSSELKFIKTIINTTKINDIKQIQPYLHNLNRVLHTKCVFVGKFIDYKIEEEKISKSLFIRKLLLLWNTIEYKVIPKTPILNWLQYSYNGKRLVYLNSPKIKQLLKKNGFHLIDIKNINGISYFVAQKTKHLRKPRKSNFFNFIYNYDI